jgi:hypothetical protein
MRQSFKRKEVIERIFVIDAQLNSIDDVYSSKKNHEQKDINIFVDDDDFIIH